MNFNFWKLLPEKLRVFKHNLIYIFFMYKAIKIGINKIRNLKINMKLFYFRSIFRFLT